MAKPKIVRPLDSGRYIAMGSLDDKAWVVSGHGCAVRVPKVLAADDVEAIAYAVRLPAGEWFLATRTDKAHGPVLPPDYRDKNPAIYSQEAV